jgi:ATP-binding cassette subfamily A (ABC1) protein 3
VALADAFEGSAFPAVAVLFLSYGLAIAPFTYLLSFCFASHSTAQNVVLLVNFITGLVLMIASLVMSLIPATIDLAATLAYVFRLFPGFCLGNGLLNLTINASKKTFGDGVVIKAESPFAWDVVRGEDNGLCCGCRSAAAVAAGWQE